MFHSCLFVCMCVQFFYISWGVGVVVSLHVSYFLFGGWWGETDALLFTPQPLRAVGVLFSPMVSGWVGGRAAGNSLSGLYLRNRKV